MEATPSLTGAMADHRLPLESARIERFARHLAKRLGVAIDGEIRSKIRITRAGWMRWPRISSPIAGAGLVVVGDAQPPWIHALAHLLNAELGNIGKTVTYHGPVEAPPGDGGTLADLTAAMRAGAVDTLLILDANPVYDAPVDLQFDAALKQVPHLLHLGLYRDETGERGGMAPAAGA